MKVTDKIQFKKVRWVLVRKQVSFPARITYWKYKVYRKYGFLWLNNTKCIYDIFPERWNYFKRKLKKNKKFHYTMSNWSSIK